MESLKVFIVMFLISCVWATEYEMTKNEMVDIEILFPKQGNPVNTVPTTPEEKEKSNRLISFIDRLLNRNPASGTSTNDNKQNTGASLLATTRRSLLSSLIFIPDVNKGVDTILNGVASGNLEQIISGSFIFTPNRVQSVASTVINRVFGGQSISNINNNNNNANNSVSQTQVAQGAQQQNVNTVLQQLGLGQQQQQQQALSNNNLGQQQSVVNVSPQQQQTNNNVGQQQQAANSPSNNIQNLITGVLGQILPNTAQTLHNGQQQLGTQNQNQ